MFYYLCFTIIEKITLVRAFFMAQQERFELSDGVARHTISNRARYDRFDTAAYLSDAPCGHSQSALLF